MAQLITRGLRVCPNCSVPTILEDASGLHCRICREHFVEEADYRCAGLVGDVDAFVRDASDCQLCACEHCIHEHDKWRWHRACRICTPRFYCDEVPNEVDTRPLDLSDEEENHTAPNLCDELDKHRPAGQPMVRCER
jgi:hypothetical protein